MTAAVVTGIGVLAPNGLTVEEHWSATLAGRSGIGDLTGFDTSRYSASACGQVRGFAPDRRISRKLMPQTDRMTRFALHAMLAAFDDARLDPADIATYGGGVCLSNACGGFEFSHRELRELWGKGPDHVSAYLSFAWFYACNTGQVSIMKGLRGSSAVPLAEQAGGLDALAMARRTLSRGTSVVVTGGVESALDPWGWVSHLSTGRVARGAEPGSAFRPFDAAAGGYVPGEGGAVLVTERADTADRRGAAHRYGELSGHASTFDPPPRSGRPPGLRRAVELALVEAGLVPRDVDAVIADAAGSRDLDRVEADAISGVFGRYGVPVSAPKSLLGRLCAGGGPLDVVAALLATRDGVLPPAPRDTRVPPEYGIDLVTGEPRRLPVRHVLVLARGRGGFNSALVVSAAPRPEGDPSCAN